MLETASPTPFMSLDAGRPNPTSVAVESWAALERIHEDHINVVVMPRRLEARLLRAVDAAAARGCGFNLELDASERTVPARVLGGPDTLAAPLQVEIRRLVDVFRLLFGWGAVGLRVATTERPMCPRFHVDRVQARMVCTLKGPGTQYLDEEHVLRSMLGRPLPARPAWPAGLRHAGSPIHTCNAGDVVLLKGESWPGNSGRGAVHRSPPAEAHDGARLVVTIDALFPCARPADDLPSPASTHEH
jgi:hypothetical protein